MHPLIERLIGRASPAPAKKSAAWLSDGTGLSRVFDLTRSYSGKAVTDRSALQLGTVWACVRLNSEAIASLPLQMFERDSSGGRRQIDHPLADILDSPNSDQTGFEFWQAMAAWIMVRGNAYAEIARMGDRIAALNIIPADRMHVSRDDAADLRYRFTDRGKAYDLPAESVLHIRGFGMGDLGLSPVQFGIQTMGAAMATEEAAASFFQNGLMSSGVLKLPADAELTDEQREQLGKLMETYSASNRAGKVVVLEGGLEYQQLSLDPGSTQMLESRRFDVESLCRWFGTPPIIIGHAAQGQTMWGSGVEAILLQWLQTGLNPYLVRIERRIRKQLLAPGERRRVFAEYNREGLLQADSAGKAAFLSTMVQNGLMTRAEGRAKLNLPARAEADMLTAQTNLAPLDKLGGADPASTIRDALGIGGPTQ